MRITCAHHTHDFLLTLQLFELNSSAYPYSSVHLVLPACPPQPHLNPLTHLKHANSQPQHMAPDISPQHPNQKTFFKSGPGNASRPLNKEVHSKLACLGGGHIQQFFWLCHRGQGVDKGEYCGQSVVLGKGGKRHLGARSGGLDQVHNPG